MRSLGRYDVVLHVDSGFLQMFLWERFGALAPKSCWVCQGAQRDRDSQSDGERECLQGRALPWVGVKQSSGKLLVTVIDKEDNFNFRPFLILTLDHSYGDP